MNINEAGMSPWNLILEPIPQSLTRGKEWDSSGQEGQGCWVTGALWVTPPWGLAKSSQSQRSESYHQ